MRFICQSNRPQYIAVAQPHGFVFGKSVEPGLDGPDSICFFAVPGQTVPLGRRCNQGLIDILD